MTFWSSLLEDAHRWVMRRRNSRPGRRGGAVYRPPALEALETRCLLSYSIIDLGTLGGLLSYAYGINAGGQVVGASVSLSGFHAFLWDINNGMQDLGSFGQGTSSTASKINDLGQVVGYSQIAHGGPSHAFLWDSDHGMQDLGTLGGSRSLAYGINNAGQVVGWSIISSNDAHAFLWESGNGMQDLGTLGGASSYAHGINESGEVVGGSQIMNGGPYHAFLWDSDHGMQDLGTLGGSSSLAYGINNAGQVVGYSSINSTDNEFHAFLWHSVHGMQDLNFGIATGINASGQVAGYSGDVAVVWDSTNGVQFLNDLVPPGTGLDLSDAEAINDAGQIVGTGYNDVRDSHAFLLTPAGAVSVRGRQSFRAILGAERMALLESSLAATQTGSAATLTISDPNPGAIPPVGSSMGGLFTFDSDIPAVRAAAGSKAQETLFVAPASAGELLNVPGWSDLLQPLS